MTRVVSAAFAVALVALVWVLLHLAWYPHAQIVDFPTYKKYGYHVVRLHEVPYRDFRLEYPPAALPTFVIPAWLDGLGYRNVFKGLMAACDAALVLAVLAIGGRRAAAFAAVAPLALGSVVVSRFDLWPTALAACSLAALLRRRPLVSGLLLGTAFAAKLWPAVLAPLFLVWLWRTQGRRATAIWLGTAVAAAAAWFVPFTVIAPGGIAHSFDRQFARPLQVESLGASVLVAVHHVVPTTLGVISSFGSQNVGGDGVGAVSAASSVANVLAVLLVWTLFTRGEPSVERLLVACAAAVAALITFGKVFSPQFPIWLFAFVPLVRSIAARVLFFLSLVLTQVYFPKRYWDYADRFYRPEATVVLARNLLVVALFVVLVVALVRTRRKAPATAPAPRPAPAAPPP